MKPGQHTTNAPTSVVPPASQPFGARVPRWQEEQQIRKRRLHLMQRRCRLFTEQTNGARCSRAVRPDQLRGAYRLMHDVFVEEGYIFPRPSGMRVRVHDLDSRSALFVAEKDGAVVGCLTYAPDFEDVGLPCEHAFHDYLEELREPGVKLVEICNQVVAPEFRNTGVATELVRCVTAQAHMEHATRVVGVTSPPAKGFYETLGFEQYGEVRSYSEDIYDPVVLMVLHRGVDQYAEANEGEDTLEGFWKRFFITENPYSAAVYFWEQAHRRLWRDADALWHTFGDCIELCEAPPHLAQAYAKRLGPLWDALYAKWQQHTQAEHSVG